MAPFIGAILSIAAFALNNNDIHHESSQRTTLKSTPIQDIENAVDLSRLCTLFGASPTDLLALRTGKRGIRGVHLERAVSKGEVILKVPLESCLRDDSPPEWLHQTAADDEEDVYSESVEGWVTRLTASLLDAQLNEDKSEAIRVWLDLLPTNLRQILPIHWDPSLLADAKCRPLELAADSAYFARAGPVGDLMASLADSNLVVEVSQREVEDALDLVQTRSCRAESGDGTPYMRVLVPIFDMINHNRDHNAEFYHEGGCMVVRAWRNIDADEEVFINYGGSTQPSWKCLFSYGFVPLSDDVYEDDVAELIVDDFRCEVGPTEIPFELVQYEAEKLGQFRPGEEFDFTPEIGQRIIDRVRNAAEELEVSTTGEDNEKGNLASSLVADLKESNKRTLLACAGGLSEYLDEL